MKNIRMKIDECDEAIIEAFEKRMEAVMEILNYKRQQGLPIFDRSRESQVMEKVLKKLKNPGNQEAVTALFKEIIGLSRKMQSQILIPYNLVLIGFMGTGKTTVGRELAKSLEMNYVDVDQLIEARLKMTISEFFKEKGEAAFRKVEMDVVKEVSMLSNTIISCGGGVVMNWENIVNLRSKGKIILLEAKEETIFQRLQGDELRPLFKKELGMDGIHELLQQRRELYINAADIIINTEDKTPEVVVDEIIRGLFLPH